MVCGKGLRIGSQMWDQAQDAIMLHSPTANLPDSHKLNMRAGFQHDNSRFLVLALLVWQYQFLCLCRFCTLTGSITGLLWSLRLWKKHMHIYSPSPYRGNNSGLKFVKLRGWIQCVSVPAVSRGVCDGIKSYSLLWNEIIIKGVSQIVNNQFHF